MSGDSKTAGQCSEGLPQLQHVCRKLCIALSCKVLVQHWLGCSSVTVHVWQGCRMHTPVGSKD
jgi:hypothetical protein